MLASPALLLVLAAAPPSTQVVVQRDVSACVNTIRKAGDECSARLLAERLEAAQAEARLQRPGAGDEERLAFARELAASPSWRPDDRLKCLPPGGVEDCIKKAVARCLAEAKATRLEGEAEAAWRARVEAAGAACTKAGQVESAALHVKVPEPSRIWLEPAKPKSSMDPAEAARAMGGAPAPAGPAALDMARSDRAPAAVSMTASGEAAADPAEVAQRHIPRDERAQRNLDYLLKAAAEPGAVRTPSGLIYTAIQEGSGAQPKPDDTVRVQYKGRLVEGIVFDSSELRGQAAEARIDNRTLRCWQEGLTRMKVGGKARLVCPPDLGFGHDGRAPMIPPDSTLIFEVELVGIVK